MAISARIDELKKKFDENPRRYFAPLANEYRKAGDLEQAISICRAYLPQQPGHISGHIVFGQALFESGQLTESRGVFETALGLDPENLIALRHLGDIAREEGDIGAARGWYQRVLDADPRNDEMAALLQSLATVEVIAPTPPMGTQLNGEAADAATSWRDVNPETPTAAAPVAAATTLPPRSSRPVAAVPPPAPPAATESLADDDAIENSGDDATMPRAGTSSSNDGMERSSEVAFESTPTPVVPHAAAPPPRARVPEPEDTLGLEVMEFVPPADGDRQTPVSGLDTSDAYSGNVNVAGRDAPAPDAFVTETMAELYLQQGFEQEALAVYRELLARNPSDNALRDRVDALSRGARSSLSMAAVSDAVIESAQRRHAAKPARTVRSFLGRMAARRVARRGDGEVPPPAVEPTSEPRQASSAPAPRREPNADWRRDAADDARLAAFDPMSADAAPAVEPPRERRPSQAQPEVGYGGAAKTNGSTDVLFPNAPVRPEEEAAASLLARAYGEGLVAIPASVTGKPARAASTELSLDHVFREVDRKTAPARQGAGYSFDQFFAEAPSASPPERGASGVAEDEEPERSGAPDDIEQFNSWLQGLKKK